MSLLSMNIVKWKFIPSGRFTGRNIFDSGEVNLTNTIALMQFTALLNPFNSRKLEKQIIYLINPLSIPIRESA